MQIFGKTEALHKPQHSMQALCAQLLGNLATNTEALITHIDQTLDLWYCRCG